jgi:hypothetical protein
MRHLSLYFAKAISICICATMIVACDNLENIAFFKSVGDPDIYQSDAETNIDNKTIDIEVDMSEDLSLKVLQATLLAYLDSPLYRYLDASDFPAEGSSVCENSIDDTREVFASLRSSKGLGEAYSEGDTVELVFDNCQLSTGQEVSGALSMEYSDMGGVNDTFMPVSTDYCVDRLNILNEGPDYDTLYVAGHEVRFFPFGDDTIVRVYEHSYDSDTGERISTLRASYEVAKNRPTLIINERLGVDAGALASLDGDEIYHVFEGEQELERCQYYRRHLDVSVNEFAVKDGEITTTIDGEIELSNISEDLETESFNIVDSDFSLSVQQNASLNEFSLTDFDAEKVENLSRGTYVIGFSGVLESDSIGGIVEVDAMDSFSKLNGTIGEYPTDGIFKVLGQGLERVTLTPNPSALVIGVDYDGDDSRVGASFPDETFTTTWEQLLEGDFQRDDFIPAE